jgi:2-haloacid dehalogenase
VRRLRRLERWATFDCYGTLVDWRGGIGGELARLFGEERAGALLNAYHEIEPDVQKDGTLSYREVMARTLARVADREALKVPVGEMDALALSLPRWPVFPDARVSLTEAHERGWRLAILSNTDRDLIDASIEALDVPIELAIVASEIGSYKPAHRHWETFAEKTGVVPDRHVHVAQSLFHDIAPARELGIRSIWINRLGENATVLPTRELPGLTDLPDTLDGLVTV